MTFGQISMKFPSLAGMVDVIKLAMSREGLHYRFSKSAVDFLYRCLDFVITQKIKGTFELKTETVELFSRILVFDSTSWDIDPGLSDIFPGFGGNASKANCKIQVGYEYKKGNIFSFVVTGGTDSDNGYSAQIPELVKKGDLVLMDMGYFRFKTFHEINQKEAYFISRLNLRTTLFRAETKKRIEIQDILKHTGKNIYEMDVVIGVDSETEVGCRIICFRVKKEIADERRRKLKKATEKKGRCISKIMLDLCNWTIMITNVKKDILPAEKIYPFYGIRWQIELVFKQFKSVIQIQKNDTENENRLRCEIYGKLICAIIVHRIHGFINAELWNSKHIELSMDKFWKRIQERAFNFANILRKGIEKLITYLYNEINFLIKNCIKLRQQTRNTSLERLENIEYSKAYELKFCTLT